MHEGKEEEQEEERKKKEGKKSKFSPPIFSTVKRSNGTLGAIF